MSLYASSACINAAQRQGEESSRALDELVAMMSNLPGHGVPGENSIFMFIDVDGTGQLQEPMITVPFEVRLNGPAASHDTG